MTTPRIGVRQNANLGRFFIITFFVAMVLIVLGIYLIYNLFDESKQMTTPEVMTELAQAKQKKDVKPAPPSDQLRIYYTTDGVYLTPSLAPIQTGSNAARGRQALETLFNRSPKKPLRSPVPHGIEVAAFYLRPDESGSPREVIVDLSPDIQEKPLGGVGAELLCVYAIVNTVLANTPGAESVTILIDGKPSSTGTLWGQVDISGALTPGALLASDRVKK